jgi:hypothetical protein
LEDGWVGWVAVGTVGKTGREAGTCWLGKRGELEVVVEVLCFTVFDRGHLGWFERHDGGAWKVVRKHKRWK